jgi:hypothetical protein
METRIYRVADGEYCRWLKMTVRSLGLLIDWNWDASVQRKVRGLAVSGPVVLVTANLFTWLFEHSNINCIKTGGCSGKHKVSTVQSRIGELRIEESFWRLRCLRMGRCLLEGSIA